MSCVPYVLYGLVFVVNVAIAVLLMCKTKTWRQYFGGCTLNIVHLYIYIYIYYASSVMYVLDFVVDVVIVSVSFVRQRLLSDFAMIFAMARLLTCTTKICHLFCLYDVAFF